MYSSRLSYGTGKSLDRDLSFSKSWDGFEQLHLAFIDWLRSAYSKWYLILLMHKTYDITADEEVSCRKGHSTPLKDGAPTRTATTSPTVATPPLGSLLPSTTLETTAATSAAVVEPPYLVSPSLFPTQTAVPETAAAMTSPAVVTPVPIISPSPPSPLPQELPPSPPQPQTAPGTDSASERQSSPHQPVPPISPHSLSPGPGTAELTNNFDQTTSEQGRLPSPEGAFSYDGPSPFITAAAIQYLQGVRAGQHWTDMVTSYLHLEEFPITASVRTFRLLSFTQTDDIIRPAFAFPPNLDQAK